MARTLQEFCLTAHNGIAVNRQIRIRDQERAPIAVDIKRFLRENSTQDHYTFTLTADIMEAHDK